MWKDNKARTDVAGLGGVATIKTVTIIVEAAVLILLIYFINKLILSDTEGYNSINYATKPLSTVALISF